MNRGRRREDIFLFSHDYEEFIRVLQEASERWNLQVTAYCLILITTCWFRRLTATSRAVCVISMGLSQRFKLAGAELTKLNKEETMQPALVLLSPFISINQH